MLHSRLATYNERGSSNAGFVYRISHFHGGAELGRQAVVTAEFRKRVFDEDDGYRSEFLYYEGVQHFIYCLGGIQSPSGDGGKRSIEYDRSDQIDDPSAGKAACSSTTASCSRLHAAKRRRRRCSAFDGANVDSGSKRGFVSAPNGTSGIGPSHAGKRQDDRTGVRPGVKGIGTP